MAEHLDATSIMPIRWGDISELPDGRWVTAWTLEMEELDAARFGEVKGLATKTSAGFAPTLTRLGSTTLGVEVVTTRWGLELDYYDLTYRLLGLIDARIGHIVSVQGTPSEWWRPFRPKQGK